MGRGCSIKVLANSLHKVLIVIGIHSLPKGLTNEHARLDLVRDLHIIRLWQIELVRFWDQDPMMWQKVLML